MKGKKDFIIIEKLQSPKDKEKIINTLKKQLEDQRQHFLSEITNIKNDLNIRIVELKKEVNEVDKNQRGMYKKY